MDLISLLITVFGVMILLALYVMSRLFSQGPTLQNDKDIKIPMYTDASGHRLSSIKADIAARDNGTSNTIRNNDPQPEPEQFVLFIASKTTMPLDGNKILAAMKALNLSFGDKQLYHYMTMKNDKLFSIANGIAPWTLSEDDLSNSSTPGLSIIMPLPTPIKTKTAINHMVDTALALAEKIEGELQNDQQQIFLDTDRTIMLKKVGEA